MGYYSAAAIVDDPDVGRLALQMTGFVITGTLFLLCGALNDQLSSTWLVVMYFLASFFGQCGPNCTTYLIPAEVFPTAMRTVCHGISAASGKVGAIVASVLFHYLNVRDLFLLSACASFAAALVTFLTIPETTTLNLDEIDRQWAHIVSGKESRYEGPAIDPRHLSFYERNHNWLLCQKQPKRRARFGELV
jgi:MFS family permease